MTPYSICFYLLSILIIMTTVMAISCRNMVHTILYLVASFIGTAMMFYLLGAPLPAALEVIIYAGGIMVLFLFIIMMLKITDKTDSRQRTVRYALTGMFGSIAYLSACVLLIQLPSDDAGTAMKAAFVGPAEYGKFIFRRHWLSIEVISLLLLVVLVGALMLGTSERLKGRNGKEKS